jgi:hypothetical protein
MGRVILKHKNNRLESLKCKSKERADEIAKKRPTVIEWNFYEDNERVPLPKKKVVDNTPMSFEELERTMRQRGILY